MKNLVLIFSIFLFVSCGTYDTESVAEETATAAPEERSIGFSTILPDNKWHLGTEESIQIVKDLDKAWSARDYETLATFFVDTASFAFGDGRSASSPAEFIELLKADDEESEDSWTFNYAYSVDLNPSDGGEHVQAGFTGTSIEDGKETKTSYHEWYYIIDGKVVMWRQYTMAIKEE